MKPLIATAALGLIVAAPVHALDLTLPASARLVVDHAAGLASYDMPIGPAEAGTLPTLHIEGSLTKQVWQIPAASQSTLHLIKSLTERLSQQGYDQVFSCETLGCGGFDFRFQTQVAQGPEMYVNLNDFRFYAASHGPSDALSLLVSRDTATAYVQLIRVSPNDQPDPQIQVQTHTAGAGARPLEHSYATPLLQRLTTQGHAVLDDLTFETGASKLGDGEFASLTALATFLRDGPARRIALVGHTDAVGSLENNIALSRARARSVRQHLIKQFSIPRAQIEAQGVGYLSPVASNSDDAGRTANRRVEAVLLAP